MAQTLPQSKTNVNHEFEGSGFYLAQFKTPELSIFSYYLQSDGKAFLIDPTFQVYPYQQLADKRNVKIISVILTHYHADFVSGHTQFNLPIIMGPKSQKQESNLKIQEIQDNSTLNLGLVSLKVLYTPGHTLESTCFLLRDSNQNQVALFTGDTIFIGQVGRPDLSVSYKNSKQDLAIMLFKSLYKIKKQVAHSVRIYPAHGSGSACGKSIGDGNFSHLQTQLQQNYALKIENQEQFVKKILQDMKKPPSYFFYDSKLNQSGKANGFDEYLKNSLKPLSIQEFKNQLDKECHVIDSRADFGGKTIKGSYLMNENGPLATWAGVFIPPQSNLLLICNKQNTTNLIQRLLRIGYLNIKGYNDFTVDEWQQKGLPISYFKIVNGKTMVETQNKINLDVRNSQQWKEGIIEGTKLISLNQLPERYHQLQGLDNIHVNCKIGGRARLASSILAKKGIQAVIVADNFDNFQKYGAKIVEYK